MAGYTSSPRERAAWSLRTAIRRAAQEVDGAEVVQVPIVSLPGATRQTLDDPLAGLRAAQLAHDVAIAAMREYAEEARGAGSSWDDIAAVLAVEADEDEPRDERVYLMLVEGRSLEAERAAWWRRPSARWTCSACGQRITDNGPF